MERTGRSTSRLIIPAAAGLSGLDAAAVWVLGALRHLLRHGRRAADNAWDWVELFDELRECGRVIRDAGEPPANCCPLVPVRMPVDVDSWPEPGEAIPVEVEERTIGAIDNRRLVGEVARLLIECIALPREAAMNYLQRSDRNDSDADAEKAARYALTARDHGRRALRGVDLDGLGRAVQAEIEVEASRLASEKAARSSAHSDGRQASLVVQFPSKKLAIVIEGNTTVKVRGQRQVWLFKSVVDAAGQSVAWNDLLDVDRDAASVELRRRYRELEARRQRDDADDADSDDLEESFEDLATPRMALQAASLQRTGNRIKKALGKLSYHWHQDGHGAVWDSRVS